MRFSDEYLAGLFDGDGCVSSAGEVDGSGWGVGLYLSQKGWRGWIIEKIREDRGYGHFGRDKYDYSRWEMGSREDISRFILSIGRLCRLKKPELAAALALVGTLGTSGGADRHLSSSVIRYRATLGRFIQYAKRQRVR